MMPTIKLFNSEITGYTIMATIGIFVTSLYCIKRGKKNNIDDNDIIILLLIAAIGVTIGGHLLYAITNIESIKILLTNLDKINSFRKLWECLAYIFGGSVFYGGLIGGLTAVFIFTKNKKKERKQYLQLFTPAIPLFHFFGRIGCFLGGCCFGIESKFGFTMHHSIVEQANGVRRFPVQLVEATCNLIIFIILHKLSKNKKYQEYLLPIYLIVYPIVRFTLEFFRGDSYRGFLFGLSTSQIVSIILFTSSVIYLIITKKKAISK